MADLAVKKSHLKFSSKVLELDSGEWLRNNYDLVDIAEKFTTTALSGNDLKSHILDVHSEGIWHGLRPNRSNYPDTLYKDLYRVVKFEKYPEVLFLLSADNSRKWYTIIQFESEAEAASLVDLITKKSSSTKIDTKTKQKKKKKKVPKDKNKEEYTTDNNKNQKSKEKSKNGSTAKNVETKTTFIEARKRDFATEHSASSSVTNHSESLPVDSTDNASIIDNAGSRDNGTTGHRATDDCTNNICKLVSPIPSRRSPAKRTTFVDTYTPKNSTKIKPMADKASSVIIDPDDSSVSTIAYMEPPEKPRRKNSNTALVRPRRRTGFNGTNSRTPPQNPPVRSLSLTERDGGKVYPTSGHSRSRDRQPKIYVSPIVICQGPCCQRPYSPYS